MKACVAIDVTATYQADEHATSYKFPKALLLTIGESTAFCHPCTSADHPFHIQRPGAVNFQYKQLIEINPPRDLKAQCVEFWDMHYRVRLGASKGLADYARDRSALEKELLAYWQTLS